MNGKIVSSKVHAAAPGSVGELLERERESACGFRSCCCRRCRRRRRCRAMAERPHRVRSSDRLELPRPKRARRPPQVFQPTANGDVLGTVRLQQPQEQRPAKARPPKITAKPSTWKNTSTLARADAVAEFLRANPGRHTRRDLVGQLWPGVEYLGGKQWRLIEGDPRVSCTVETTDSSAREIWFYRAAGTKRQQTTQSAAPRALAAGTAGHGPVDTWMDTSDVLRRLRAFARGRQTFEGFEVFPAAPSLGAPNAGSVFFHRLGTARKYVQDDYEWRHPNGTTNDGVLKASATLLAGKPVLTGRHSVLPTDPDFQRRTFYLAEEEEEPSVRMVQYIHARRKLRPAGGGLKRHGASRRREGAKKQQVRAASSVQLKDTAIAFRHKLCDLDEVASQRKQLRYKAVIVGAGTAGLGAARQLIDVHGMHPADILVLEGGGRIGGRIHTKLFEAKDGLPAVRVDLGASYLHGYDFDSCVSPLHSHHSMAFEPRSFAAATAACIVGC